MAQSLKGNLFLALIAGTAGGVLVPMLRPALSSRARPAAKAAVRAGFFMYERARGVFGEWAETASDLVAEVQAELEDELQSGADAEPAETEQVVPFEMRSAAEREKKFNA